MTQDTARIIKYLAWQQELGGDELIFLQDKLTLLTPLSPQSPETPNQATSSIQPKYNPTNINPPVNKVNKTLSLQSAPFGVTTRDINKEGAPSGAPNLDINPEGAPSGAPNLDINPEGTPSGAESELLVMLKRSTQNKPAQIKDDKGANVRSHQSYSKNLPSFSSLQELYQYISNECNTHEGIEVINANGPDNCQLAIITMEPTNTDVPDKSLFSGPEGAYLNRMLEAINIKRTQVYCTSVLKFAGASKTLNQRDKTRFKNLLFEEIKFLKTHILVILGEKCAQLLLKTGKDMDNLRKIKHPFQPDIKQKCFIVTYHPTILNTYPDLKLKAWEDLQWIQSEITTQA